MQLVISSLLILAATAHGARILGVFPHPSHSHQVVFNALCIELAKRGHELVIFTTVPQHIESLPNLKFLVLDSINKFKQDVNFYEHGKDGIFKFLRLVYSFAPQISMHTLSHPVMQQYLAPNNTVKFDLILVQVLYNDAVYGLAHHFDAPMIGVSSLAGLAIHTYMMGDPLEIATTPDPIGGTTDKMNLWQRIENAYLVLRQIYEYETILLPAQEAISRKFFGDKVPHVREFGKRMSLYFTYTHPFYTYPRAHNPSTVHIGGCRKFSKNQTLPADIKEILDNSKYGVIYFSLGSNLKSAHLPESTIQLFMEVFSELPYTILWKFERNQIPNKPANVITRKWMPQEQILTHPKIALVMYQGGLQSTEEIIYSKKPVVGFPMFSDQRENLIRLHEYGVAEHLDLRYMKKNQLKDTVTKVITDPKYKENAVKLHNLLYDLPYDPMDWAMWWIEHVIRHKGAAHLYNRSREMPLYQTLLLDVIAVLLIPIIVVLCTVVILVRFLLNERKRRRKAENGVGGMATKKHQ